MINIDIVADIVCLWCFIGKRRLETAIALVRRERPNVEYNTCWRPFFLNPDTPPEGEPYLPFLEQKFGSRAAVDALFDRVRVAGRAYGIEYAFEKIALRANTLHAHRLLYWAQQHGSADKLIERLFQAQFQNGEHIGDPAVLVGIAAECGYDPLVVAPYLASTNDSALVLADAREIRQRGVRMVPTFILEDEEIIVGAEDPAVLADAILRLCARGKL